MKWAIRITCESQKATSITLPANGDSFNYWEVRNQLISTALTERLFQIQHNEPIFSSPSTMQLKQNLFISPKVFVLLCSLWMPFGRLSYFGTYLGLHALSCKILYAQTLPILSCLATSWNVTAIFVHKTSTFAAIVEVTLTAGLPGLGLFLMLVLPALNCEIQLEKFELDMQASEKLSCSLWKMWQGFSPSKSKNWITDLCSSSIESMVAITPALFKCTGRFVGD